MVVQEKIRPTTAEYLVIWNNEDGIIYYPYLLIL